MTLNSLRGVVEAFLSRISLTRGLVVLAVAACLHQIVSEYYYGQVFTDQAYQYAATRALLEGHGLTIAYAHPDDLALVERQELISWPLGYSLALAPFLLAVENDWLAMLCLDWFSIVLFFGAWVCICVILRGRLGKAPIFGLWAYWAVAFTPFMLPIGSSANLALALYSAGLAFLAYGVVHPPKASWPALLASGALVGLAGTVRYGYWPLAAVGPLVCLATWRRRRIKAIVDAGLCTAGPAMGIGSVIISNILRSSHATYLTQYFPDDSRRLYWGNLLAFDPFPSRSLGIEEGLKRALRSLGPGDILLEGAGWCVSLLLVFVLAFTVIKGVRICWPAKRPNDTTDVPAGAQVFLAISSLGTICLVVMMLCYLSVRYPSFWSPVGIKRYYAATHPFFLLFSMLLAFSPSPPAPGRIRKHLSTATRAVVILSFLVVGFWRVERLAWHIKTRGIPKPSYRGLKGDIVKAIDGARFEANEVIVYVDQAGEESRLSAAACAGAWLLPVQNSGQLEAYSCSPVTVVACIPEEVSNYRNKAVKICDKNEAKTIFRGESFELRHFRLTGAAAAAYE